MKPIAIEFMIANPLRKSATDSHDNLAGRTNIDVATPRTICPLFCLEGKSDAEINLYKVFHRRIERMLTATDPVIAGLAKDADMRSKPILEPTADVPEKAIVRYVRRGGARRRLQ
jgi:hypothetical protein